MKELILATKSKRRIKILESLNIRFRVLKNEIKELPLGRGLSPKDTVIKNAVNKATEAAKKIRKGIVVSADTIIYKDGKVLGKPGSKLEAQKMLNFLKGKTHYVYTGLAIYDLYSDIIISDYERTKVIFRDYSPMEVNKYLKLEDPTDKAGSYNLDGMGAMLYAKIDGCYYNVLGLPLAKLEEMFKKFGISIFDFIK